MIGVGWNPVKEGCVRESIELVINTGDEQQEEEEEVGRHEIVFVGSATRRDSSTSYYLDSSSNDIIMENKEEELWNGVSIEYSEIREEGSHSDLVVEGVVGLTISEEEGSMIEYSSLVTNGGGDDGGASNNDLMDSYEVHEIAQMMTNANISPKKASMAAKSLTQVPDEAGVDQDQAVGRQFINKAKLIMAVAQEEEIDSERLFADENRLISQTSQDFVNGLYMNDKVRHLLDDFDAESSTSADDGRSGRSTPTFGSLSSGEEEQYVLSDVPQSLHDEEQAEPHVETTEEEKMTADTTERDVASSGASLEEEKQQSAERFATTTSDHYDKVTAELNALMEDVSEEVESESDSDNDSNLSCEECDQSRDDKLGIFNFNESMSNEENEELNMLPETSIDNSSDWDSSSEPDRSIDSGRRRKRNPYRQMSSDLDALMDEFSELEQFAQMQQDYLISPTTHDFQTQLENINEQIDTLTPSPIPPARDGMAKERVALRIKETGEFKAASEPPTPKDSAQKCYFYKPPPKENPSTLSKQSRNQIEERRGPYKSPFAAVLEAETSFQSIDRMLDGLSSSDESNCASESVCDESNCSDSMMVDSSSFDESICSGESEFDLSNNSSANVDDDSCTSLSSNETSSSVPSQKMETNFVAIKALDETRSEQIALLKSKLSSLKVKSSQSGLASPSKIPQPNLSTTRKPQLNKTPALMLLDVASLTVSAPAAQKSGRMSSLKVKSNVAPDNEQLRTPSLPRARQYSSPSNIPQPTPSTTRKLQLKTPVIKPVDVASLVASASTAQTSARMTYGYFSQSSENSPSDSKMTGMLQTPMRRSQLKIQSLKTPVSKRDPTKLKTPSSMSAYEKHIERMRSSRKRST